jgi:hypothetical protein
MFYIQPFQGCDRFCILSHRLHRWLFIVVPLRGNIEQLHSLEDIHKYYKGGQLPAPCSLLPAPCSLLPAPSLIPQ